ncbi:GspH/FimT family pseudopilin [Pseudohalioglobus lutimaris]|uniref:GspH/FimT family pseudopilin n=1 Tax=Pseudohalioglobus lutimaris TaxID=1737061 RepID=UPI00096B9A6A|nr:GspH/FimT family pseudopilin [Pseudohalioglobus lutimaris]
MKGDRQRGFSLLELLVALFVVVLVTSLVTLNIGSGDRDILLQAAVEGLADSANYALDEAQFTGVNYALAVSMEDDQGQWRFHFDWYEESPTGWQPPTGSKEVFAPTVLPPGVVVQLELDGVAEDEEALVANPAIPQPQLVFYASGETAPGAMTIRETKTDELLWRLEWDLLGNFQALRRGQSADEEDL